MVSEIITHVCVRISLKGIYKENAHIARPKHSRKAPVQHTHTTLTVIIWNFKFVTEKIGPIQIPHFNTRNVLAFLRTLGLPYT